MVTIETRRSSGYSVVVGFYRLLVYNFTACGCCKHMSLRHTVGVCPPFRQALPPRTVYLSSVWLILFVSFSPKSYRLFGLPSSTRETQLALQSIASDGLCVSLRFARSSFLSPSCPNPLLSCPTLPLSSSLSQPPPYPARLSSSITLSHISVHERPFLSPLFPCPSLSCCYLYFSLLS